MEKKPMLDFSQNWPKVNAPWPQVDLPKLILETEPILSRLQEGVVRQILPVR